MMSPAAKRPTAHERYLHALRELWERSAYDRGFISNPFAGDADATLGLKRTRELLDRMGKPDRKMRLLHVAGSKGKGSTCAFASSILSASGFRTGRYTSPHLHTFRERLAIDGALVSEESFADLWDRARDTAESILIARPDYGSPTAFELTTAMAFDYFAVMHCDAAVIEVGLGGTLDATNVIQPESTVITALDYEHARVLGSTMTQIASNKAGIIKPGVPIASASHSPEAEAVIRHIAEERGAPWICAGRDWTWEGSWDSFNLHGPWGTFSNLSLGLIGDHQIENASLAVAGLWPIIGERLTEELVRTGLRITRWPGRFEIVNTRQSTIVLDGAHTPASAAALAQAFRMAYPDQRADLVLGLLNDKDPSAVFAELAGITSRVIAVTPPTPRGLPAEAVSERLRQPGLDIEIASSIEEALAHASGPLVLVTGSLTTVARAREVLGLAIPDPPVSD